MRCPHCGKQAIVSHVTIRWVHVDGSFLPERGFFCTACGRAFDEVLEGGRAAGPRRAEPVSGPQAGRSPAARRPARVPSRFAAGGLVLRSVRVPAISDALRRLQESADVIVIRHANGLREVVY